MPDGFPAEPDWVALCRDLDVEDAVGWRTVTDLPDIADYQETQ